MAIDIVRRLRAAGHTAYLAGGCVRDELLGLHPTDYDVATDAPPQRIADIFPRTAEVGASFGVVLVRSQGVSVEVATFRSDGPYSDRRRPDTVHFSDPESDAQRRDFTINALFLDPLDPADSASGPGRVIDFVNGQADLRDRVLRAVGDPDLRLAEDHLRALRAVRFAARLSLDIDPPTAEAIKRRASGLEGVSRERIGDELRRMLLDPSRGQAVVLLQSLGLDAPALNEPSRCDHPALVLALGGPTAAPAAEFATVLSAWALDRGFALSHLDTPAGNGTDVRRGGRRPSTALDALSDRWRRALCLSNEESHLLAHTLTVLGLLEQRWNVLGVAALKRTASESVFPDAIRLLRAMDGDRAARVTGDVHALAASPGGLAPPPLATGDDLVAAGLKPGPAFREILESVYDAQLEGRIADSAAALELAIRLSGETRS